MDIDILTLEEIEGIAQRIDFTSASQARITTADMKPIDTALGPVKDFLMEAAAFEGHARSFAFEGVRHRPAPPDFVLKHLPPEKRGPTQEQVSLSVSGAKVDGFCLLRFADARGRQFIWGLAEGGNRLIFSRDIPLDKAMAFKDATPARSFARMEALLIEREAKPGASGDGSPRI